MLQATGALLARDPAARLRGAAALARTSPDLGVARGAVARAIASARSSIDGFPARESVEVIRSVVIKSCCSPHERGILLVSFEEQLAKLLELRRFQALEEAYKIVFLPTWHPFFSDAVLKLAARARRPFGLMPSLFSEEPFCSQLGPLCDFIPLHAASWVNPDFYPAAEPIKSIDLLMLASFAGRKRHWRLFEALSRLPSTYRVVLIGFPWGGRNEHDLRREARAFGVEDRIEIVVNPSDEAVRRLLAQTKLFCALSHKEGSYIAVAEALIAGVPVAAFANARFGTKAYINRQTGVLLDPKQDLAAQLRDAVEHHDQFAAAEWARENISARVNCAKLDRILAAQATHRGEAWTRSIKSFYCKRFEFFYYDTAEAEAELADDYQRLRQDFGLTIVRPTQGLNSRQPGAPRVSKRAQGTDAGSDESGRPPENPHRSSTRNNDLKGRLRHLAQSRYFRVADRGRSAAELQLAAKTFVERMFGNRIWIERATEVERIRRFMTSVHPLAPAKPLKRFGAERDGGYLMPDDLEGVMACVSLGVSTEIGFDLHMAERGLEVIMADASVDGPPKANPRFHFTKKFVDVFDSDDTTTMENLLRPYESLLRGDLILQMDIEGSEYRVVLDMNDRLLKSFRIMIIEAHRLDRIFASFSFDLIAATFRKLLRHHSVVHIHPNNFRGSVRRGPFEVPRVMEFTFYRHDRGLNDMPITQRFPHPLDADNTEHKSSLVLPLCWR